jgi:dipeptidyl aminopeptidase/acylaminoacyl peptidase
MDCIIPGVKKLIAAGFVDPARIGLQGQSWGGYQTAYIVTQTGMFRAGMAGAPVSNMTSAYGGIRWESGLSRMFQYEKAQSRIGGTLWEKRDLFIKNSPLFFADKVTTPLLIMANDNDGAVPWYQGIEFFTALRRLGKPAWMLTYNTEAHNLVQRKNRKDLSIRMMQFFDHFLKDAPMPVWMKTGIPAVNKGKTLGLEIAQ